MLQRLSLKDRLHASMTLAWRDFYISLFSPAQWLGVSAALLLSSVVLGNYVGFIIAQGAVAIAHPLFFPFIFGVVAFSLYLGLASSIVVGREREQGILEVLFYGPVDHTAYILAKFLAQALIYLSATVIFGVCFFLYSQI
ncbi:MAG: hypothetical protein ACYC7H_10945, partial [Chloroflexota bacterium]